jgi:hypothetical protein
MSRGPVNMVQEGRLPRERLKTVRTGPLEGDVLFLHMSFEARPLHWVARAFVPTTLI